VNCKLFTVNSVPRLRLLSKLLRSFAAALLASALSFFVSLFVAIMVLFFRGFHAPRPDMSVAYRLVAVPVAIGVFAMAFVVALAWQVAQYRRHRIIWRVAAASKL
jgi:formate hydrogenlyase subunit 3/multisubunit Na+/H+ antiporter MnhD subunit